jgi:hypothetical protein
MVLRGWRRAVPRARYRASSLPGNPCSWISNHAVFTCTITQLEHPDILGSPDAHRGAGDVVVHGGGTRGYADEPHTH